MVRVQHLSTDVAIREKRPSAVIGPCGFLLAANTKRKDEAAGGVCGQSNQPNTCCVLLTGEE